MTTFAIRPLSLDDLASVVRIDALHTGRRKPAYWRRVLAEFLEGTHAKSRVGLAVVEHGRMLGYLIGEIRAFEFGSEPCGWIFAVGVDPGALHRGVGTALVDEACRRFRRRGMTMIRTMVRRNDVPLLAFFRANGFAGGAFVELEKEAGS